MNNRKKFKIVAIATVVALVSGFQFNSETGNVENIPMIIGIEEAYAGPCNDNGCVGGSDHCMTVSILWGVWTRTCTTTVPQTLQQE